MVVSPETQPPSRLVRSSAQLMPEALARPWSGRLLRAKWRRPALPPGAVSRPRLMDRLDQGGPFTLIVAPAGFGKTIAAVEWANREPAAAWLTVDAADASLHRFWAHLRAALADATPEFGELVTASLQVPHRASAADLGRILADELLDAPSPVRLVIDDLHLIPESESHDFLAGLLEMAPPGFSLVATARSEPPLPLTRMRMRGAMSDVRGADLLFTEVETRTLVAQASLDDSDRFIESRATALWQRTRGWAAGLRLGTLTLEGAATPDAMLAVAEAADSRLLSTLLDETLAERSLNEREVLLRAALADRFNVQFAAALVDGDDAGDAAPEAVRFALAADLCRPSARLRGDWLEFHPLFLAALRQRLAAEETEGGLRVLHARAARWFEDAGLLDPAITHSLAAGELTRAIDLVEREMQPAFAREDWPSVARWLALLPSAVRDNEPELLLAQAWLAHLRGQALVLRDLSQTIERRLCRGDLAEGQVAAIRAEISLLTLSSLVPFQIDQAGSLSIARLALERIPASRRFPRGFAMTMHGLALQAAARHAEAVAALTAWTETPVDVIDAGLLRGFQGLLWVHSQEGELALVESVGAASLDLAHSNHLRLSAGWAHRFLGEAAYERNDLDQAIEHFSAVVSDYEYFHLTGLREVFFVLALAYAASGRDEDARRTLKRARDIVTRARAIEHLAALDAYEAWLAFRGGEIERALAWARPNRPGVDDVPLHAMVHPATIRAAILCASGDRALLAEGLASLEDMRRRAAAARFLATVVRIDALLAVAFIKHGEREAAAAALHRSVAVGARNGFCRAYLDLAPSFAAEMRVLAATVTLPRALHGTFQVLPPAPAAMGRVAAVEQIARPAADRLSEREAEILEALAQRLTYKEIADRLFISPLTVKRHASTIYSKLGATGRADAVRVARELGWAL